VSSPSLLAFIGFIIWNNVNTTATLSVETISLEKEQMKETVMIPGISKFNEEQFVYYRVDKGEIAEIFVEPGDTVKKDDKLLKYANKQLVSEKGENQLQIDLIYLELDNLNV